MNRHTCKLPEFGMSFLAVWGHAYGSCRRRISDGGPECPRVTGIVRYYSNYMSDVISDYQRWKQQGDDLRLKAKQAMESRFRELLSEAAAIAEEYRSDFGLALKPPAAVTAFRFKAHGKAKAKKTAAAKPSPEPKPSPKVAGLQKRLATA